jgi:hypothetical protein
MCERLIAAFLLASAGLLANFSADAGVTRCTDPNGKTLYTDSACPAGMRGSYLASLPQVCSTEDCERRRERELEEANVRLRAEKEQLAAYTAERHKRELEDRWMDEARYQRDLREAAGPQVSPDEPIYADYYTVGIPWKCGRQCKTFPHRRAGQIHRLNKSEVGHHRMKGPANIAAIRAPGNEPSRPRATTAKRVMPIER